MLLRRDQSKLLQRGQRLFLAGFFRALAIDEAVNGRSREVHPLAARTRAGTDREVTESGTRMRAASFPTAYDIVSFGNEVPDHVEGEVMKRFAKLDEHLLGGLE